MVGRSERRAGRRGGAHLAVAVDLELRLAGEEVGRVEVAGGAHVAGQTIAEGGRGSLGLLRRAEGRQLEGDRREVSESKHRVLGIGVWRLYP